MPLTQFFVRLSKSDEIEFLFVKYLLGDDCAYSSDNTIWGEGLDHSDAEIEGSNPA
jgi:hypothetical protein